MRRVLCVGLGLPLVLAACGGADTPVTTTPVIPTPTTTAPPTTTTPTTTPLPTTGTGGVKRSAAQALLSTYEPSSAGDYATTSSLPTSGSATFTGQYYGDISTGNTATDSLIGDLTLTTTFTTTSASVTGSVTNLVDNQDRALTGSLTLNAGSLDRSVDPTVDNTFAATASGALTNADGQVMTGFSTQLEGDFLSSSYNAIGGAVLGGFDIGTTSYDFDGGFIAER